MHALPETSAPPPVKQVGFLKSLGPGLVTGAADDDPSGIATYSQVGAQFGYGLAWTIPFSFPLSFVPEGPRSRSRLKPMMRFKCAKSISTFLRSRRDRS